MANNLNFGEILRSERERRHEDLLTVARKIRIRPDVLSTIEDSDLDKMPPRGYSRNMLNAYARYLGLNPTEIVKMYQNALYERQTEQTRTQMSNNGFTIPQGRISAMNETRAASGTVRSPLGDSYTSSQSAVRSSAGYPSRYKRDVVTSSLDDITMQMNPVGDSRSSRGNRPQYAQDSVRNQHISTMYSAPDTHRGGYSKLPFFIAAGIILILCVTLIFFMHAHRAPEQTEEAPVMNVTGMPHSDTTSDSLTNTTEQAPVAPAPVVAPEFSAITYEVDEGNTVYMDIGFEDDSGKISYKFGGDVTGPATETYDITADSGKLVIVTTDPSKVRILQDGKEVALEANENGIATVKFSFDEFIENWEKENKPEEPADTAGSTSGEAASTSSAS